jgi:hypothetical protein
MYCPGISLERLWKAKHIVTYSGLAWRIITGSGFVIGFIDTCLQLQLTVTAHTLNSSWMTSVWRISHESRTGLYYSRIHECTAFYNCHATGIEVAMLNSSSVLLYCHGNVFVTIGCRGNKCLPSRCLTKMTSASAIIMNFRQCLPSLCLANGHISSQYFQSW